MRLLLPLMLILATCWAGNPDPLLESVPPRLIQAVPGNYRLPDDVTPVKYIISLEPFFEHNDKDKSFTFNGQSDITLNVKTETNKIVLHSKYLTIDQAKLTYKENERDEDKSINVTSIEYDNDKTEHTTLTFNVTIKRDFVNTVLTLTYAGKLNDNLRGFYRSSYQKDGKTRWLATTHFEPTGARQAFPCWDEPAIKTTFEIRIKPPSDEYHVLSNTMNTTEDKDEEGYVQFAETPKMSTYLVAFVVSDFVKTGNDEFRVWSKPTSPEDHRKFAFNFGQKALETLEKFTNISYKEGSTISKMDQISIPQFSAGAMENWGLVTYRESALLYNKDVDTTAIKQSIATVIAHEFAHQWFGNRVTCNWWSSIWLNEGFATFFEYYIPDHIEEKEDGDKDNWRLMEQFAIRALQASAFVADASAETHALTVNEDSIQTPQQISNLFDDISYKKGGCILRMMQQFLTEQNFKLGLRTYLKAKSFDYAEPKDLFEAMYRSQKSTLDKNKLLPENITLDEVMKTWVYEPGYPVVTVTTNETHVTLTQKRFFADPQQTDTSTKWYIPITYRTENSSSEKTLWLKPNDEYLSLKLEDLNITSTSWILFNNDQTGYYRVNYDDNGWKRLAEYLKTDNYGNISAVSRAQLIDDALNLARAGETSYNNSLLVTAYLNKETDYISWSTAFRALDYHANLLHGTEAYDKYISYVAEKAENFVNEYDYTNQNGTHVEKLAKVLTLKLATKYGVGNYAAYAKKELQKWLSNNETVKIWHETKNEILCAGLREADDKTVENVLNKYNASQGNEQSAILAALGCHTNEENIKKLLAMSINKKSTIKVNVINAMNSIYSGNPGSLDILLEFIEQNITQIKEADPTGTGLANVLNNLATRVKTEDQLYKVLELAHLHLKEDQKTKLWASAVRSLNAIKSYRDEASAWVEEETKPKPEPTPSPTPESTTRASANSITLTSIVLIIPVLLARFN